LFACLGDDDVADCVGTIDANIINILGLTINSCNIYLGESNISHMESSHPDDYKKYGKYISDIINYPNYVGLNSKDNSIEYVKEFTENNHYVKVAVRVSGNGNYYARSIYVLNSERVKAFIEKNKLKPVDRTE